MMKGSQPEELGQSGILAADLTQPKQEVAKILNAPGVAGAPPSAGARRWGRVSGPGRARPLVRLHSPAEPSRPCGRRLRVDRWRQSSPRPRLPGLRSAGDVAKLARCGTGMRSARCRRARAGARAYVHGPRGRRVCWRRDRRRPARRRRRRRCAAGPHGFRPPPDAGSRTQIRTVAAQGRSARSRNGAGWSFLAPRTAAGPAAGSAALPALPPRWAWVWCWRKS